MSDANKQLVQRWFDEVWNQGNAATIQELFSPNTKAYGFPNPTATLNGPVDFAAAHRNFNDAFSNIHVELDELVAEDDKVAVRWTVTMTHTGDNLGFAATGRTVLMPGSTFVHIKNGKIADGWNHLDFTRVLQDLQSPSPTA
jgi:steroid delta-isomerase-like uncharacterized protein